MKIFWVWCLVALLCVPNMALAHSDHSDAVGIRVFDMHSHSSGYVEKVEVLSGCLVVGDTIETDCLADKAYDFAQSIGALSRVPESNQFRESYKDLFLRWNDLGSTVSVSRFMRKATGTGFYLPQGSGRSTPLSYAEWSLMRGEVDLLQQQMRTLEPESTQSLRDQINVLKNLLVGVDLTTAGLLGTLTALEAMVDNFPTLLQTELETQKAELEERLLGFAGKLSLMQAEIDTKADKADVANIEAKLSTKASQIYVTSVESQLSLKANQSDVANLAVRMDSFENPPSVAVPAIGVQNPDFISEVKELWFKYGWLLVILLLVGVLAWLLKSRKNTSVTKTVFTRFAPVDVVQSPDLVTTEGDRYQNLSLLVSDPKTGLEARVGRLENNEKDLLARMDQLDTSMTTLRADYDYLLLVSADGLRMVGTPDQKTLDALTIGKHIDLLVEGNEGARTVRIVRGTFENENGVIEDRLYLYGVSEVNIGVRVDSVGLSRCLLKAVKDWRVVGIDDHKVGLSAAAYKRNPTTRKAPVKRAA